MSESEIDPQEVILIPVDQEGHVLLYSDVKIESVDTTYRTVSDPKGLSWKLPPGEYRVRIFLRTLEMHTVPVKITAGVSLYKVYVEKKQETTVTSSQESDVPSVEETPQKSGARLEDNTSAVPRHQTSFPVSYRTNAGRWVNSKSVNLSTTGVCVENMGQVGEDDTLYVRLHLPVSSVPIECPARVVWIKLQDVPRSRMGLQLFLTDNMRTSIINWLSLMER